MRLKVSIPQRDFGEFQLPAVTRATARCNLVSIPQRDFGEFQRCKILMNCAS
ncbi:hypothetical protein CKA32_001410 [Geitlerinema sp. FC II]|nr:hypothetical protein CKA32_001410 [Geitlerinema sp. FC II]